VRGFILSVYASRPHFPSHVAIRQYEPLLAYKSNWRQSQ
jgi:hypothetical protein